MGHPKGLVPILLPAKQLDRSRKNNRHTKPAGGLYPDLPSVQYRAVAVVQRVPTPFLPMTWGRGVRLPPKKGARHYFDNAPQSSVCHIAPGHQTIERGYSADCGIPQCRFWLTQPRLNDPYCSLFWKSSAVYPPFCDDYDPPTVLRLSLIQDLFNILPVSKVRSCDCCDPPLMLHLFLDKVKLRNS